VTADIPTSATKKKFGYTHLLRELHCDDEAVDDQLSTIFMRCSLLSELVKGLACTACHSSTLAVRAVDCTLGVVCMLETHCTSCGEIVNKTYSSDRLGGVKSSSAPFVVVRSLVSATMDMGVGHSGLVKLCRHMDMPAMHHSTFNTHMKEVTSANMRLVTSVLDEAAQVVRKAHKELDPSIDENGIIDITVSYDGTWMTRGFKSLYGAGCVVDVITGLVLDFSVKSLYCQTCTSAKARLGADTPEFDTWFERHFNECNINYTGNPGGMEVAVAEDLWDRSVDRHGFRYTTILSDGDAKTFKRLSEMEVYGPDVTIEKEECVNHVAKRMKTALLKLAAEGKKRGVVLGGQGHGKLTGTTIKKLAGYYDNAIRSNRGNLEGMREAVFASFFHTISTDEDPHHTHCPEGATSWCFYQKALAKGEEPGSHHENVHTALSREVASHVKDVYLRLGHRDLLNRCLRVETQNKNESIHSKIWTKCPKTGFVGLMRVVTAVCASVAEFNEGIGMTVERTFALMAIPSGQQRKKSARKADQLRLKKAERQVKDSSKQARHARKMAARATTRATTASSSYSAGAF